MQKVFIRNVPLRFYAKNEFCVCFEVHIPVIRPKGEAPKVCSLLEWSFIISIDTSWDWFQRTYVLITAQKNL